MNFRKSVSIILICVVFLFSISGCGNKLPIEQKFLKNNYEKFDVDKQLDIKLIKDDLMNKEVFLSGEYHRIFPNKKIELQLIKYLRENANMKYLLVELSCSNAVIINSYLESGDENILRKFFDEPSKSDALGFTTDAYVFYKELYKYNKSLLEEERLKVVGVDVDFSLSNALWALQMLLGDKSDIKELNLIIDKVNKLNDEFNKQKGNSNAANIFIKDVYELSIEISKDIEKNSELYKKHLGDKYFDFEMVSENLKYSLETKMGKNGNPNEARDGNMYRNFNKYYNHLPKGKYFGQFGMNHAFQQSIGNEKYFATELNQNNDSPVKGKVLTIAYLYNSEDPFLNSRGCSQEFLDMANPFIKSDITLFKLTGKESPYEEKFYESLLPVNVAKLVKDSNGTYKSTTEFYQYVMVIKNPKQTYPWRE